MSEHKRTSDDMKLMRDGQLSAGPALHRRIVRYEGGRQTVVHFRLATEHDVPNQPGEMMIGGHRYILRSILDSPVAERW